MPVSANEHLRGILDQVRAVAPQVVIDLGMGEGSYGRFLRHAGFRGDLIGVEVWAPYLCGQFALARGNLAYYDKTIVADVRELAASGALGRFDPDLMLMIDVLEHMERPEAAEVLQALRELAPVVVCTPIVPYPQDELHGNPFERHRYDWRPAELEELGGRELARAAVTGLYFFPALA